MFTGFKNIDLFLPHGLDGKHIVLAGHPRTGKTALALSMAINIALDGYSVAYLSEDGKADALRLWADNILFKEPLCSGSAEIKFYDYDDYKKIGAAGEAAAFIDGIKDLPLFLKREMENPCLFMSPSLTVFVSDIPVPDRLCKILVRDDLPPELDSFADVVLFLHNRNAIIAKNDDGLVGIAALEYVEKYIFREYPEFGNCYIEKYRAFKDKNLI